MLSLLLRRILTLIVLMIIVIVAVMMLARGQSAPMISFIADINGQTDIFVLDTATRTPVNLTESRFDEWSFAWSQSGTLTYTASVNPAQTADELFMMIRPGIPQLIDTPQTLYSFGGVWSPDGRTYAYFSSHPRNISDIYTINISDFTERNLTQTDDRSESNPLWSPDGRTLLYRLDGDLYLLDMMTGEQQVLVDMQAAAIEDPVWSPDGAWLIFYNREWVAGNNRLIAYLVSREGGQPQPLQINATIHSPVTWSPDSNHVALITDQSELSIYNLDTQNLTTFAGESRRFAPAWSPDGRWIAFIQNRHLYGYDLHTQRVHRLLAAGRIKPPLRWYPD